MTALSFEEVYGLLIESKPELKDARVVSFALKRGHWEIQFALESFPEEGLNLWGRNATARRLLAAKAESFLEEGRNLAELDDYARARSAIYGGA